MVRGMHLIFRCYKFLIFTINNSLIHDIIYIGIIFIESRLGQIMLRIKYFESIFLRFLKYGSKYQLITIKRRIVRLIRWVFRVNYT